MTVSSRRQLLLTGLASCVATTTLSGCASSPNIDDYALEKPALDLREYFNGVIDAWGVFTDRQGKVIKRFTVVMHCSWTRTAQGEEGVLDEDFVYADGTRQKRIWHLSHTGDGRYIGRADDVVGQALGQTRGNTFQFSYTLALPVDGTVWHVNMDDWMFLMNDQVMLNKARMSKWGIHLGDVTLSFKRRGTP